jgi:hypothetical protein
MEWGRPPPRRFAFNSKSKSIRMLPDIHDACSGNSRSKPPVYSMNRSETTLGVCSDRPRSMIPVECDTQLSGRPRGWVGEEDTIRGEGDEGRVGSEEMHCHIISY